MNIFDNIFSVFSSIYEYGFALPWELFDSYSQIFADSDYRSLKYLLLPLIVLLICYLVRVIAKWVIENA